MKLQLDNISAYIKSGKIPEVTSSELISSTGMPHDEGLLSYTLFGTPGTPERKKTFGFIKLSDKAWFMTPAAYEAVTSLQENLSGLLNGNVMFEFSKGEFRPVEDETNPPKTNPYGYGTSFFKRYFEETLWISKKEKDLFTDDTSPLRRDKIRWLRFNQTVIFIREYLVIPPYYRDAEKSKINELNKMYRELLNKTSMLREHFVTFGFSEKDPLPASYATINDKLVELYQWFLNAFKSKRFVHQNVLGRDIDNGVRAIISAPNFNTNDINRCVVDFFHTAVPLQMVLNLFSLYIVKAVHDFMEEYFQGERFMMATDKKGVITRVEVAKNFMDDFSRNAVITYIDNFFISRKFRLEPVKVRCADGTYREIMDTLTTGVTTAKQDQEGFIPPKKNLRWIELFYYLAEKNLKDKHVLITRYPVLDANSVIPFKMNIIPMVDELLSEVTIRGEKYKWWPNVEAVESKELDRYFIDSVRLFPTFLSGLGGDYDGDMVTVRGIFSPEANDDCVKHMNSKSNITYLAKDSIREFRMITKHAIYNMTREEDEF